VEFCGWFRLKGKLHKIFNTVVSTKCFFLILFWAVSGGGLLRLLPGSLLPLFAPLTQWLLYNCIDVSFHRFVIIIIISFYILTFYVYYFSTEPAYTKKFVYITWKFRISNTEIRQCILLLPNVLYCNVCHPYVTCQITWRPHQLYRYVWWRELEKTAGGSVKCSKEITYL